MSEVLRTMAYPDDSTGVTVNGAFVGLAHSVKERIIREQRPVYGFGDTYPTAFVNGRMEYELEIIRTPKVTDLVFFTTMREFDLGLKSEGIDTQYGPCRCIKLETQHTEGGSELQTVTLRALSRSAP